ncbi:S8 family serine peptidase [Actinoplanes sp. NBRC 101535]|uniref:S8 family serine peptidase n=1 Tax=Actinoplanes sp. NBRC 101535 TaxID=3032196 RepID=UPI0025542875|nr:S8 family serine peptidase [Actinoplanes sp. NBRC 101535]
MDTTAMTGRRTRIGGRSMAIAVAAVVGALGIAPGASAAPGQNCAEPGEAKIDAFWPRLALGAEALEPVADGSNVKVAVLSTGVDAGHPLLDGKVGAGVDVAGAVTPIGQDCTGSGTQVAGVITDLAPGVEIVPVRTVVDDPAGNPNPGPAAIARGITAAVQRGARVVVVAAPAIRDDESLADAVRAAVDANVVVISAVEVPRDEADAGQQSFPAAYDEVIGVGVVDQFGAVPGLQGRSVDLVAPGIQVPTTQTGGGLVEVSSTGVAAGFVGAAAALVRDRRPGLRAEGVRRQLIATASAAPATRGFGLGVVDPVAAVTGLVEAGKGQALSPVSAPEVPDTAAQVRARNVALAGSGVALALVGAVLLGAAAVRRSRASRWRPALTAPLEAPSEPLEPGPPVMLLDTAAGTTR